MLLEKTGKAMLSGDFKAFMRCFALPHIIETPDKKTVLKTRSAMREVFNTVVQEYADRGVTDLIRICEVAEYRGPFRVEATHITHMMSGNHRVQDPFPGFSVLEFIEGRWQVSSSQYAVDKTTTVGRALEAGIGDPDRTIAADNAAAEKRKN